MWLLKLRKELLRRVNIKRLNSLKTPDDTCDMSVISYQNLKQAEKAILMFLQKQEFPMEMNNLTSGNSRVPCSSRIRNLDPFLDDGLIRVCVRLHKSSSPDETSSHYAKGSSCVFLNTKTDSQQSITQWQKSHVSQVKRAVLAYSCSVCHYIGR